MKDEPLISVIVPVYNVEPYLKRCVDSITAQTYKNLEILLVDDGSTDRSGLICDELSANDERIKVTHQKNQGAAAARNLGMDRMNGEWVFFIDSDDYLSSDCIRTLFDLACREKAEIASAAYRRTSVDDMPFPRDDISHEQVIDGKRAMQTVYGNGDDSISIIVWNKLFLASYIGAKRYDTSMVLDDEEFVWELLYRAKRIAITTKVTYAYFMSSGSIMRGTFNKRQLLLLDVLSCRAQVFEHDKERELWELTQKTRCYVLFSFYRKCKKSCPEDQSLWKTLRREFFELVPHVLAMRSVRGKSKISLLLMCFFPIVYEKMKG